LFVLGLNIWGPRPAKLAAAKFMRVLTLIYKLSQSDTIVAVGFNPPKKGLPQRWAAPFKAVFVAALLIR